MGADRAIHVQTDEAVQPLTGATILQDRRGRTAELVILGKQAIDDDSNQTGQMLATLLGRPQATFASKVESPTASARDARSRRRAGDARVELPAVVTTDLRLNEPRFISCPTS